MNPDPPLRMTYIGTFYPLRGGIAHYNTILVEKLRQAGHTVNIISFKRQYPKLFFPGKTQHDQSEEVVKLDSNPVLDSINPFSWFRVARIVRRQKPQVVLFKYWLPFFAPCFATISWLVRGAGIKTLLVCDNIIPHEKRPGDLFLTKWMLRVTHYFIVQSNSVKNDLLRLKPQARYREVAHPVYEYFHRHYTRETARAELLIDKNENVILFFGYIRSYKGLEDLLNALPQVWKEMSVKVLICGEFYEGETELKRKINAMMKEGKIQLVDEYIPNEKVGMYFEAANCVVLPYRSATQSGIIQIAYHYDTPVIATAVGGLPEVVPDGKCGFIVSPEDPTALAKAIIRFFREDREKEFVKNVKLEKQKYSWNNLVKAVESFFVN